MSSTTQNRTKSAERRELVWMALKENGAMTTKDIAQFMGLPEHTARDTTNALLAAGCIGRVQRKLPAENFCGFVNVFEYEALGSSFNYVSPAGKVKAKVAAKAQKAQPDVRRQYAPVGQLMGAAQSDESPRDRVTYIITQIMSLPYADVIRLKAALQKDFT